MLSVTFVSSSPSFETKFFALFSVLCCVDVTLPAKSDLTAQILNHYTTGLLNVIF